MNITFKDKIEIACHIERKLSELNIKDSDVEEKIYNDMESQFKREFGLNKNNPVLDQKYLYQAHEMIDCYEPPLWFYDK